MSLIQLRDIIQELDPEVREKASLLECAKTEVRKRLFKMARETLQE